ncbi:hypothetical protein Y695_03977 [Hydrogenophaga sp. T4]|nr:hypothetical protein Y695_03977 [Hydrogenophaga sp. T4]
MRHWRQSKRDSGKAITLPTSRASPVSRKGGTCDSDTPSAARDAQSAMAPRASRWAVMQAPGALPQGFDPRQGSTRTS